MSEVFDLLMDVPGLDTALKIVAGVLLFLSVLSALWIIYDASLRFDNKIFSILAGVFLGSLNILGILIYTIIRPESTVQERKDLKIFENLELNRLGAKNCLFCSKEIPSDSLFCVVCGKQVAFECEDCKSHVDLTWNFCKKCGRSKHGQKELSEAPAYLMGVISENQKLPAVIRKNIDYSFSESFVPMLREFFLNTFQTLFKEKEIKGVKK